MTVRIPFHGLVVALVVLLTTVVFGATPASAEPECVSCKPWWHLTASERPTYLQSGQAQNEIQYLTVKGKAKGEQFALANLTAQDVKLIIEGLKEPEKFSVFEIGGGGAPEASVIQAGLEEVYGVGAVEVKGGTLARVGLEPYAITFKGGLADQPVRVINTELSSLLGFTGTVNVTQAEQGRPDGQVVVTATNLGDAEANGESGTPITLAYKLPPGIEAVGVIGQAKMWTSGALPLECSLKSAAEPVTPECTFKGKLAPYNSVSMVISVVNTGAKAGENGEASVSGGGAPNISHVRRIQLGESTPFGVDNYELINENEGGGPDTQAGSHPVQQTTTIALNETVNFATGIVLPVQLARDLHFHWPAGLVGNPSAIPQCEPVQFQNEGKCPPQTAVGVADVLVSTHGPLGSELELTDIAAPLFNMVPSLGEPARLAFLPLGLKPVYIDPSVRTGEDYGITVNSENITQVADFISARVTVWGVPGASIHDRFRGLSCLGLDRGDKEFSCEPSPIEHPAAFLSLPTSCTGPRHTEVFGESWSESKPTAQQPLLASYLMPALDGCDSLPFTPSLKVTPDGTQASKPTGLAVNVHIPQQESLNPGGLAEAAPRNITVALPEGLAVNPSSGDGLQACSEGLVGFEGFKELQPGFSPPTFTPTLPGSFGSEDTLEPGINFCANASKIGTVRINTPILPNPIEGAVYLASQNQNPFGSLIALYVVAEDPVSGVAIKLAGDVHLTESGQLVTMFENSPQAPFEDAEFHFFGGERAPLTSPARCGAYTAIASMTPWSQEAGEPAQTASSTFNITSGPNGSPCPGPSLPFNPSLTAQTTDIQAGGFTPLTTTIGRADGQQDMQSVTLHFPPGVSGLLSGVKLCPEAQANEGTCSPESLIGETIVSAGVGSDPVSVKGGKVYITEKYAGAPFGLSIVNPVKAGPFDLERDTSNPAQQPACDCVVVRAKVQVDPTTAALTVTTDASGPHAIPHLIDGIPVQIQKVNVLINREHFTFNPTNCDPQSITGSIASDEGASSPVSVPFQVTNCATLAFAPKFQVSTSGKTSKANGASLAVRLSYPSAPFGSQANIRSVKVDLPKLLPSRLTTLQKACTAAQFNTNPAGCPAASFIGHARAVTPLLPVALEGPAIFVSHGGEAFPSLIIVLQGAPPYNVTLDLVGSTFISKAGITSSTFKTVPDAPVGLFELTLPQGPYSALAANGDLCTSKLVMPTEFLAQNGAKINRSTALTVTGCSDSLSFTHKVKQRTLTLSVYAPAAGKITAGGKGLTTQTKTATHQGNLTITLKQKKAGKLKTTVQVAFTPSTGKDRKKQTKTAKLTFKK